MKISFCKSSKKQEAVIIPSTLDQTHLQMKPSSRRAAQQADENIDDSMGIINTKHIYK